jgi:hypothetical protein
MASAIDATKPVDGIPALKSDLRDNLQTAKDEIEALQSGKADLGHQHVLVDVTDAGALAGLNQVGTGAIADGAVTTAKIASGAVIESKIADTAITANKIATGAITESKIADAAITQSKIAVGAITGGNIADAAITQSKIAADAIGAAQLQDGIPINMQDQVLTRPELKDFSEASATPAPSAGALTLDLETGNVFEVTLTGNVTSLTLANPPAAGRAGSATLILRQDATGGRTLAWPASVRWAGGMPPVVSPAANAVDIYAFMTRNGGATWFGFPGGQDFS